MTAYWVVLMGLVGFVWATERPIVGVLAQEFTKPRDDFESYITSNYVKAVEAAGARVVPVFIKQGPQYYRDLVRQLNGLLIPGGSADYSRPDGIGAAANTMYHLAIEECDKGGHFPILGVCQGMELLAYITGGKNPGVLVNCSAEDVNLPLRFRPAFRSSSLYGEVSEENIAILSNLNVTANFHSKCVTEKSLAKAGIRKVWKVLSTNLDKGELEFVSSMEDGRGYPVAGVQFHPEKNAWEWSGGQHSPHGKKAVAAARVFYDWLVREARRSSAAFDSFDLEKDSLIYNYSPVFTGKGSNFSTQQYWLQPK